jgi:hypothetical protein
MDRERLRERERDPRRLPGIPWIERVPLLIARGSRRGERLRRRDARAPDERLPGAHVLDGSACFGDGIGGAAQCHRAVRLSRLDVPLRLHLYVSARQVLQKPDVLAASADDQADAPVRHAHRRDGGV